MSGIEFRSLRADEIECRIGQISKSGKGLSLLLFKTARTDMDILDETVGAGNWQCRYYEMKGTLFCSTGIRVEREDGCEWVWKDDAGSPSNMEAAKGEASDARKRSCVAWGIGRELYTAPRIWVYAKDCNIQSFNGKYQCFDHFSVERIDIRDHEIAYVSIRNDETSRTVFTWARPSEEPSAASPVNAPSMEQLQEMSELVERLAKSKGVGNDTVIGGLMNSKAVKGAGVQNGEIRTARQAAVAIGQLNAWIENGEGNA